MIRRAALFALLLLAAASLASAKSPIRGLVTMGDLDFLVHPELQPDNSLREANVHPGLYAGAVILATWADLEPQQGQFDLSSIEHGLDAVRAYNARNPATPLVAKLRVFGGANIPGWVKQLGGGPIEMAAHRTTLEMGRFWSAPYRDAWAALQRRLAAQYDANPLMGEVAISACSSKTAEPFGMPQDGQDIPLLLQAGYSDAAMKSCLLGALDDYAVWRQTPLDYTVDPWRDFDSGRSHWSAAFTINLMHQFRQRYGDRAILANHGLNSNEHAHAIPILDEMQRMGGPIEFQTDKPRLDWEATIQLAERLGATEFEMWDTKEAGGGADVSAEQLRRWRAALAGK